MKQEEYDKDMIESIEMWLRECELQYVEKELTWLDELQTRLLKEESEKPMDLDGLDEEVHSFFDECIEVYEVPLYGKVKEEVITADCYEITARHFAQWGAEHLKK